MRRTRQQQARDLLDRAAKRAADARPAIYLRPQGLTGIHDVMMEDGRVVKATASRTQARGSEIVVITEGGGRGRRILEGGPPSGRQGVSLRPTITNTSSVPLPNLPDIPFGFGPVAGPWGRDGTLLVSRHQLVLFPSAGDAIRLELRDIGGNPHPTVSLFGGDVVIQEDEGPPDGSRPYHHHDTPGCDLAIGGWPSTWSLVCQAFGSADHDIDIPIVNPQRNTQCYIDGDEVRCFDVFPGSASQVIVAVIRVSTGTGSGGFGTNEIFTETIYEIDPSEAGF